MKRRRRNPRVDQRSRPASALIERGVRLPFALYSAIDTDMQRTGAMISPVQVYESYDGELVLFVPRYHKLASEIYEVVEPQAERRDSDSRGDFYVFGNRLRNPRAPTPGPDVDERFVFMLLGTPTRPEWKSIRVWKRGTVQVGSDAIAVIIKRREAQFGTQVLWYAMRDRRVIAAGTAVIERDRPDTLRLGSSGVDQEFRRKGVYSGILHALRQLVGPVESDASLTKGALAAWKRAGGVADERKGERIMRLRNGSRRRNGPKYERCVRKVKARVGAVNPWAVCTKSVGRNRNPTSHARRRNPDITKEYALDVHVHGTGPRDSLTAARDYVLMEGWGVNDKFVFFLHLGPLRKDGDRYIEIASWLDDPVLAARGRLLASGDIEWNRDKSPDLDVLLDTRGVWLDRMLEFHYQGHRHGEYTVRV